MKYLLLLLPILLMSCSEDIPAYKDLGIVAPNLTLEEQGYPMYKFTEMMPDTMEATLTGAIKYELLQSRREWIANKFDMKEMKEIEVQEIDYASYDYPHLHYRITMTGGEVTYFTPSCMNSGDDYICTLVDDSNFYKK